MSSAASTVDRSSGDGVVSSRTRGFLRRLNLSCAGGEGLDGFDLGLISVVLPLITKDLHSTPLVVGLIGASSLLGIFVGAPLGGLLADRFGRRLIFALDLIVFVVLGLLQSVVTDPWQLFVVRVLLGVAIGTEYTIGAAMLAEFSPARGRGRRLSALLVAWFVGFLVAVLVSYALVDLVGLSWRWVLATSVVPAIAVVAIRWGLPESPRWLVSHGRSGEAHRVVDDVLGGEAYWQLQHYGDEADAKPGARALFQGENLKRLIFISVFWICNVTPYFAIFTFAPTVLKSLQVQNSALGTIVVNAIAALGALVGMLTIERMGRRMQAVPPFWIMAAALLVVGLWSSPPAAVVVACFAVFSFFNALGGNLTAVYPIEIFPTEVRSSAVGFAAAASRIGAAAGTFLLPIGIGALGIGVCMVIGAAICVVGAVVSQFLAPETTGRDLHETSRAGIGKQAAPVAA